jgi:hypothetical protein
MATDTACPGKVRNDLLLMVNLHCHLMFARPWAIFDAEWTTTEQLAFCEATIRRATNLNCPSYPEQAVESFLGG